jgi:hypothetical protein
MNRRTPRPGEVIGARVDERVSVWSAPIYRRFGWVGGRWASVWAARVARRKAALKRAQSKRWREFLGGA